ncbi:MAG: hypothetical protein LBR56_03720 [Sporomusaceae bacterium]|jgi:hypothetical protein|nr:hypothetical protein [Sporomusaceae bacterium]
MANIEYDMAKLSKIIGFDPEGASRRYISHREYSDKLADFTVNSQFYLGGYTPSVVIYNEDDRRKFLADLNMVQFKLFSLGALFAAAELKNLSDAVDHNEVGILSDRLIKFRAEMNILTKEIQAARIEVF